MMIWRGALRTLRPSILATSCLTRAHYMRGDYMRAIELAMDNVASMPAKVTYEPVREGSSGGKVRFYFCPTCGSCVYSMQT